MVNDGFGLFECMSVRWGGRVVEIEVEAGEGGDELEPGVGEDLWVVAGA